MKMSSLIEEEELSNVDIRVCGAVWECSSNNRGDPPNYNRSRQNTRKY